jgi:uncharacterized protein with HEPN domain
MKLNAWDFLDHMIEDCEDILEAVKSIPDEDAFYSNRIINKSVTYSLLNLGELMKSFSDKDRESLAEIPWKNIIGFRDRAAHGYHALDLGIIWNITQNHISPLLDILKQESEKQSSDSSSSLPADNI